MFGSRKNPKREKCSKMPQNPTRQVHALLGFVYDCKSLSFNCCFLKSDPNIRAKINIRRIMTPRQMPLQNNGGAIITKTIRKMLRKMMINNRATVTIRKLDMIFRHKGFSFLVLAAFSL
jgi:hypothetical protein